MLQYIYEMRPTRQRASPNEKARRSTRVVCLLGRIFFGTVLRRCELSCAVGSLLICFYVTIKIAHDRGGEKGYGRSINEVVGETCYTHRASHDTTLLIHHLHAYTSRYDTAGIGGDPTHHHCGIAQRVYASLLTRGM